MIPDSFLTGQVPGPESRTVQARKLTVARTKSSGTSM